MSAESVAANLVMSRLLVLQTKRLMLNSIRRRLERRQSDAERERADHLGRETELAQHQYRKAVLAYGSPASTDYWLVAYGRLIETGGALRTKLSAATGELAPGDRYEVSTDIEMLDGIIAGWNESMRAVMTDGVA